MSGHPRRIEVLGSTVDLDALFLEGANGHHSPILMIHENRGLVPYMIAVMESLAEAGHTVLAPDLLTRIGGTAEHDPGVTTRLVDEGTHEADLVSVYDWMADRIGRPAVLGLCFGAEMGWRLITRREPRRAALLYGIGPEPSDARRIRVPVYAAYAQDDDRVNDTLPPLCDALISSQADITMECFPGTRHAFHDHTRPDRYDPKAAEVVWKRTLDFLSEN